MEGEEEIKTKIVKEVITEEKKKQSAISKLEKKDSCYFSLPLLPTANCLFATAY